MKYIIILLMIGCDSQPTHHSYNRCKSTYSFVDQTNYDVYPTVFTKKNIAVDTSKLDINLSKIDRLTDEVEQCLYKTFGNPILLPNFTVKNGECKNNTFSMPIHRECLTVKVAADWFSSKYEYAGTHHQQLPYTNGGMCTDKGLPAGICYYRNGIQDNLTIVVPPSFYLYKDALLRIITGCSNPWYDNLLSACMEPTTNPLDDGTQP